MVNKDDIRKLIAADKLRQALDQLMEMLEKLRRANIAGVDVYYDELHLLLGRYNGLQQDINLGTISRDNYEVALAKVRVAAMGFTNKLPAKYWHTEEQTDETEYNLRDLIAIDDEAKNYVYDVFMSFSKQNKEFVENLVNFIRGYKLRVFVYYESIPDNAGEEFLIKISNALGQSRHFILVCTPEAMKSKMVKTEHTTFYTSVHHKNEKRKFIIFEGEGFTENLLPLVYQHLDRIDNTEKLISALVDTKTLSKLYKQKQAEKHLELETKIENLEHVVKQLTNLNKLQDEQLKNKEGEITTKLSQQTETEKKVLRDDYDKQITQLNATINQREQQLKTFEEQLTAIEIQVQNAGATGDTATLCQNFENEITQLKAGINAKEADLKKLRFEVKNLSLQKDEHEKLRLAIIEEAEKQRNFINSKLTDKDRQLNEAKNSIDELKHKLNQTEKQLQEAKTQIVTLKNQPTEEYNALKQQITGLEAARKEASQKLIEAQQRIRELQLQSKKLPTGIYRWLAVASVLALVLGIFIGKWLDMGGNTKQDTIKTAQINTDTPITKPKKDTLFTEMNTGMKFALVEAGTFTMGSETPPYKVTLTDDFYMGIYEVTVGQFKLFIDDKNYKTDAEKEGSSYILINGSWNKKQGINWRHDVSGNTRPTSEYNHPVIHVSWNDAQAFCLWLSEKTGKTYRLPTEAEWEYAGGGGATNRSEWAGTNNENELGNYAWYNENSKNTTHPVGDKKPNQLGLFDMSGNVLEWCSDWYGDYPSGSQTNPTGAVSGSYRMLRGGSWYANAAICRSANRNDYAPGNRSHNYGFRVARAL